MTFKNYLEESNINKKNWENLKKFMKKQPGFKSWEFEGDYETLVIKFKANKQAITALQKSNDSALEVSAFGDASGGNSEIRVELNKDAMNAMNETSGYSEDLDEAIKAKKVYDHFVSLMTKIQNIGTYYAQDRAKVDKMNRRILTDYAGNDNKLKEIYKQITKITKNLEDDFKELESIIG